MSEQPKSLLEAAKELLSCWDSESPHDFQPFLLFCNLRKAINKAEDEIKSQETGDEPDTFSIGVKAMEEFAAPWPEVEPDAHSSGKGEA